MSSKVLFNSLTFLFDLIMSSSSSCNDVLRIDSFQLLLLFLFITFFLIVVLFVWKFVWYVFIFFWQRECNIRRIRSNGVCVSNYECIGWGSCLQPLEIEMHEEYISLLNCSVIILRDSKQLFVMLESSAMSKRRGKMVLSPLLSFFTHDLLVGLVINLADLCSNFEILNNNLVDLQKEFVQDLLLRNWIDDHSPHSCSSQNSIVDACRDCNCVWTNNVVVRLFS